MCSAVFRLNAGSEPNWHFKRAFRRNAVTSRRKPKLAERLQLERAPEKLLETHFSATTAARQHRSLAIVRGVGRPKVGELRQQIAVRTYVVPGHFPVREERDEMVGQGLAESAVGRSVRAILPD